MRKIIFAQVLTTNGTTVFSGLFDENENPVSVETECDDIHDMQAIVGGCIEPIYFEPKETAIAWCNDEFLLNGSQPNRIVGNVLVHGTFFVSGNYMNEYGEWDSCSLTDDQIKKYSEMFETPIIVLEQMQATEIEVENTPDEEMADGPADKPEPEITM